MEKAYKVLTTPKTILGKFLRLCKTGLSIDVHNTDSNVLTPSMISNLEFLGIEVKLFWFLEADRRLKLGPN